MKRSSIALFILLVGAMAAPFVTAAAAQPKALPKLITITSSAPD